jgi:hypothetical protein
MIEQYYIATQIPVSIFVLMLVTAFVLDAIVDYDKYYGD